MIDIVEGDLLRVASTDKPVKHVGEWENNVTLLSRGMRRMMRTPCSTKRATISGTKRSAPTAYLTGLKCSKLDPVTAELASSIGLDTPQELKQCFVGDESGYLRLIVEDNKR